MKPPTKMTSFDQFMTSPRCEAGRRKPCIVVCSHNQRPPPRPNGSRRDEPWDVRRLDDALLAVFGQRYLGLHGNTHREALLQTRMEKLRAAGEQT